VASRADTRRWMYRGGRPRGLAKLANRFSVWLVAAGMRSGGLASLKVRGRRSGRLIPFPVVITEHDGGHYLVAMLGERTNWARNVRAAGGVAVLRHGRREAVVLEEVEVADRAPIIKRYLEVAPGGRPHIPVDRRAPLAEFEEIADRYPVFRIRTGTGD
jgi:deazaflavin-dependent oxidoreductase (nitroreductase family)